MSIQVQNKPKPQFKDILLLFNTVPKLSFRSFVVAWSCHIHPNIKTWKSIRMGVTMWQFICNVHKNNKSNLGINQHSTVSRRRSATYLGQHSACAASYLPSSLPVPSPLCTAESYFVYQLPRLTSQLPSQWSQSVGLLCRSRSLCFVNRTIAFLSNAT